MAAVEVTINGIIWDKALKAGRPVVLIGEAFISGLSVGGGPVIPPEGEKPPTSPPGIWPGPGPLPHPEHPIAPGGRPPGIWGGPIDPYPGHPLPEPPPIEKPPEQTEPPIEWKVIWHPTEGWVVVGVPQFPHPAPGE